MDNVATLSAADRQQLFAAAAAELGFDVAIVEKEFWVCWMLKRVFTLPNAAFENRYAERSWVCALDATGALSAASDRPSRVTFTNSRQGSEYTFALAQAV